MKTKVLLFLIGIFFWGGLWSQDWAGLERFRKENEKIGAPSVSEKRVVFMGNSIMEVWISKHPGFFSGRPYINRGISGQTTSQMLLRFRQDVIQLEPAVVVLLAGTNDIAGNTGPATTDMIAGNIASMIELAQTHGIKVILCSVLPAAQYFWAKEKNPAEEIPKLNERLKQLAAEKRVLYLDCFSAMTDGKNGLKPAYTYDGVHPTEAGYDVMEPLVEEAIRKVLE